MPMFLPLKTNDVVKHLGDQYVVKGVQVTESGPVVEIQRVSPDNKIVHISEVKLDSYSEQEDRLKSISPQMIDDVTTVATESDSISLPSQLSVSQKSDLKIAVQQIIKSMLSK